MRKYLTSLGRRVTLVALTGVKSNGQSQTTDKARTLWQFLALEDDQLEAADLVEMNLSVAREIPSLKSLDVHRYCRIVDDWTEQFRKWLRGAEKNFHNAPSYFKNDIHFFRVGMLAGYMGKFLGIRYIESHKKAKEVRYTNPSELFLNGVIDTKWGSCGNMAALHVAMSRRMGWPVSLACAKSHFLSRFDNGKVIHNIEATHLDETGGFTSDPDNICMKVQQIPKKAVECGSDLRSLSAREMMGAFLGLRGRHYIDVKDFDRADLSYSLSRVLFPRHRRAYIAAMAPMFKRGEQLFESDEGGHPNTLSQCFRELFWNDHFKTPRTSPHGSARTCPSAKPPVPTINSVMSAPLFSRSHIEGAGQ